jgi:hypothetical protein
MAPGLNSLHRPAFLLHPNWLAAALAAVVFLQFALNRGGSDQAIWVAGLLLALQLMDKDQRQRALSHRTLVILGVTAALLLLSWAFSPAGTDTHRSLRVVRFVILVLAVHHLAHHRPDRAWLWVTLLVSAIVIWQLGARHLAGHLFGTFDNPHYLAYFAALLLPVLVLLIAELEPPYRWFAAVILLLAFDPVLNILWAPTIPLLAIGAAVAVVAWSATGPRVRRGLAVGAAAFAVGLSLYLPGKPLRPIGQPIPGDDERVQIWSDTVRMIADGDGPAWLIGHGIGSFQEDFARYSSPAYRDFALPHNHFLELLYENGVVGLTLVLVSLGYLALHALRLARMLEPVGLRRLARCNLAALTIWFTFSFLAFSLYSRYTLYPFAILVGIHLFLSDEFDAQARARRRGESLAASTDQASEPCPTHRSAS